MTHWQTITRALHAKGGGPLRRVQFDHELATDGLASTAIGRARELGLVVATGRYGASTWSLTDLGREWCEGRALIVDSAWRAIAESETEKAQRIARLVSDSDEAWKACAKLTKRQRHVLILIAKGFTGREVAAQVGIHYRSLGRHVTNVFNAIGCDRSIEAAVIAAKAGIV
jgi:DNA-binding NarL/FixJ family response regulator